MTPQIPHFIRSLLKIQENINFPEFEERDIEYYLLEQYIDNKRNWKRILYYKIKPSIPRFVQLALRKKYIKRQSLITFPAWPIEPIVVKMVNDYLTRVLECNNVDRVHRIAPWPMKKRFAFALTHDVEWDTGLRRAPAIVKIEKEYGFTSSWNLVPERYPIDWKIVDKLRAEGCEIGVHGYSHDGKLFQSEKIFTKRVKTINECAKKWGAKGFRSESTLRNTGWMHALEVEYDTSFPDTDPYEPQPGGCCSILPFFIDHLVELPITLPQDHTLFEILGQTDISFWKRKTEWIEEQGGLVLLNVHPDYMQTPDRIALYEEFLSYMKQKNGMWHTLPYKIARWWRERANSRLTREDGILQFQGECQEEPSILETSLDHGVLKHQFL